MGTEEKLFSAFIGTAKRKKLKKDMPGIYADIQNRVREAKAANNAPVQVVVSPADELKKFKELLDMGVISQEEFDTKKKRILEM